MTAAEHARSIVEDPEYLASVLARARAGELDPDLETLVWELAADSRRLMPADAANAPLQSRTLALIFPPRTEEVQP